MVMSFTAMRQRLLRAAEKRRYPRVSDRPIYLVIDGETYKARDWSLGGFSLRGYPRPVGKGDRISGEVKAAEGLAAAGRFVAEVSWVEGDGTIGLRLLSLEDMRHFAKDEAKDTPAPLPTIVPRIEAEIGIDPIEDERTP